MAERRMFAKSVVHSARFLRMPATARLLYYDLGMNADDDGIVEAFTVMRTTSATEADLHTLEDKGFVHVFNDELVSYVVDWKKNNQIRKDRYTPSIYASFLEGITDGQPMVNQGLPQYSKGEVSTGKESTGEGNVSPAPLTFGTYNNVHLTAGQLAELQAEYPSRWMELIEKLSAKIAMKGYRYENHLAAIRLWAEEDAEKERQNARNKPLSHRFDMCDGITIDDYKNDIPLPI
jgi:hypothetical protein